MPKILSSKRYSALLYYDVNRVIGLILTNCQWQPRRAVYLVRKILKITKSGFIRYVRVLITLPNVSEIYCAFMANSLYSA